MGNIERLQAAVGAENLLTEPGAMAGYSVDWTGRWRSEPVAVLLPETVEQAQATLAACADLGLKVVVQGGNTGLVGGAVGGEEPHVILVTKRLRQALAVSPTDQTLVASSGYTLAEVQAAARAAGLYYGVDLAARDSATIGGTVATNAGGTRVVGYGDTAAQVVSAKLLLANGEVVVAKPDEIAGSEGRLGIITEVTLRLQRERSVKWTGLAPVADIDKALSIADPLRGQLLAAEIMQTAQAQETAQQHQLPMPQTDAPWLLLLEGDGEPDGLPEDAWPALQTSDVEDFWQLRELQSHTVARRGNVLKLDTSVPTSHLADFVQRVQEVAQEHGVHADDVFIFGHLLVGNLHLNFAGAQSDHALEEHLLNLVRECAGRVAAEHGIGRAKWKYINPQERAELLSRALSYDPAQLFNPE